MATLGKDDERTFRQFFQCSQSPLQYRCSVLWQTKGRSSRSHFVTMNIEVTETQDGSWIIEQDGGPLRVPNAAAAVEIAERWVLFAGPDARAQVIFADGQVQVIDSADSVGS